MLFVIALQGGGLFFWWSQRRKAMVATGYYWEAAIKGTFGLILIVCGALQITWHNRVSPGWWDWAQPAFRCVRRCRRRVTKCCCRCRCSRRCPKSLRRCCPKGGTTTCCGVTCCERNSSRSRGGDNLSPAPAGARPQQRPNHKRRRRKKGVAKGRAAGYATRVADGAVLAPDDGDAPLRPPVPNADGSDQAGGSAEEVAGRRDDDDRLDDPVRRGGDDGDTTDDTTDDDDDDEGDGSDSDPTTTTGSVTTGTANTDINLRTSGAAAGLGALLPPIKAHFHRLILIQGFIQIIESLDYRAAFGLYPYSFPRVVQWTNQGFGSLVIAFWLQHGMRGLAARSGRNPGPIFAPIGVALSSVAVCFGSGVAGFVLDKSVIMFAGLLYVALVYVVLCVIAVYWYAAISGYVYRSIAVLKRAQRKQWEEQHARTSDAARASSAAAAAAVAGVPPLLAAATAGALLDVPGAGGGARASPAASPSQHSLEGIGVGAGTGAATPAGFQTARMAVGLDTGAPVITVDPSPAPTPKAAAGGTGRRVAPAPLHIPAYPLQQQAEGAAVVMSPGGQAPITPAAIAVVASTVPPTPTAGTSRLTPPPALSLQQPTPLRSIPEPPELAVLNGVDIKSLQTELRRTATYIVLFVLGVIILVVLTTVQGDYSKVSDTGTVARQPDPNSFTVGPILTEMPLFVLFGVMIGVSWVSYWQTAAFPTPPPSAQHLVAGAGAAAAAQAAGAGAGAGAGQANAMQQQQVPEQVIQNHHHARGMMTAADAQAIATAQQLNRAFAAGAVPEFPFGGGPPVLGFAPGGGAGGRMYAPQQAFASGVLRVMGTGSPNNAGRRSPIGGVPAGRLMQPAALPLPLTMHLPSGVNTGMTMQPHFYFQQPQLHLQSQLQFMQPHRGTVAAIDGPAPTAPLPRGSPTAGTTGALGTTRHVLVSSAELAGGGGGATVQLSSIPLQQPSSLQQPQHPLGHAGPSTRPSSPQPPISPSVPAAAHLTRATSGGGGDGYSSPQQHQQRSPLTGHTKRVQQQPQQQYMPGGIGLAPAEALVLSAPATASATLLPLPVSGGGGGASGLIRLEPLPPSMHHGTLQHAQYQQQHIPLDGVDASPITAPRRGPFHQHLTGTVGGGGTSVLSSGTDESGTGGGGMGLGLGATGTTPQHALAPAAHHHHQHAMPALGVPLGLPSHLRNTLARYT